MLDVLFHHIELLLKLDHLVVQRHIQRRELGDFYTRVKSVFEPEWRLALGGSVGLGLLGVQARVDL